MVDLRMKLPARTLVIAAALAVLASTTACDSVPEVDVPRVSALEQSWPATEVYGVPDQIRDATMVWSSDPGIDLFSKEGTVLRAAQESLFIGWMIGLDYTYLGFAQSSSSEPGGPLFSDFQARTGRGPFAGTIYSRVQQIIPTELGFDALSCVLSVGLDEMIDGKYSPSLLAGGDGAELRSRFIRTGDVATAPNVPHLTSPPPSDELHWQAPLGNEFIGWGIELLVDQDPATSQNGRCVPWAKSLYPDAPVKIARDAYARDNPPPVQPAYPGWPNNSN